MNNALVTTGLIPLTINSIETFQLQAFRNGPGTPWDLTGGSAKIILSDPNGFTATYTAMIAGGGAQYTWQVPVLSNGLSSVGTWLRTWDVTDASGVRQVSRPVPFTVISSPV